MNVIIGATCALLIAGFLLSARGPISSNNGASTDAQIQQLETRLSQLESALQNAPMQTITLPLAASTPSTASVAKSDENVAELERVRAELKQLKEAQDLIEEQAVAVIEDALSTHEPKKPDRRGQLIKSALVMARVTEYDNVNKIIGIQIDRVGNVNSGDVLGIRRNAGIIGRITVGMIDRNQGVADPVPGSFFGGTIDIQPGDELILPPL
ncbi:hypothetical protein [Rubritalea marina]|uniref:hypothetical protein n=1 Tax=Rubritalea marina TaxID=361055 RepID=UPI0012EA41A0|nr:hypothetical protein [Rubritalea marina]